MTEQPKISDETVFAAARELCECARDTPPESWSCSDCERDAHRALEAAYPLLRKQWEAEQSECDQTIVPGFGVAGAWPVACVRKPLGHPLPHRSADGMEWRPAIAEAPDAHS